MTTRRYSGLTVVANDPVVQLVRHGRVIYEEAFTKKLAGMSDEARERWLMQRAGLLVDEYVDGAFDTNGDLDPWEP
jgi:hypothetical protein